MTKINIEGMGGSVVLCTPVDAWRKVNELWLDFESNDPVPESSIVDHLAQAGLVLTHQHRTLRHYARPTAA